jgi:HAD superfamily hydrolase (TIGR01484 family)
MSWVRVPGGPPSKERQHFRYRLAFFVWYDYNMNEVKLVLADLDGTVVEPEAYTASENVIASLREAESRGVKFAAITGRPYWMAKDLLKVIGFNDPCIFEGGAIIMNPATDEVLWSKTVPVDTTKTVTEMLAEYASIIEYGAGIKNADEVDSSDITEPALSIWASVPAGKADDLVVSLRTLPDVAVHANAGPGGDFTRTGIQVTHFEADKEHAVKELLLLLNVDKKHTLAIGDGNNDLPLFRGARVKIAMGNASDQLKAASDHVVASVSDNGFAEAIHNFT